MRLQRVTPSGEARIGHEIFLRVERFLTLLKHDAPGGSVSQYVETLLVVHDVAQHDLAKDLFEEAADDRLDPDVFRQAGHLRPQAADAAHDEVDLDAGTAGIIKRIDDV